MAHVDSSARPRRGPTLTQQIFIGLAIGIVAGWFVSDVQPRGGHLLPSLQPDVPAPDQDDHRAADLRDAGRRDRRRRPRQGRRPDGPARDHLLRDRHDARARHRPGRRQHHASRASASTCRWGRQSEITAKPQTWDQILLHVVPESVIRRDGRRRRAADRRLQHLLRDRARHDRREGPPGRRLVRGGRRDDVQVHEHRDALRADRRRRGDRLHRRPRRPRRALATWPSWWRRSTSRSPCSSSCVLAAGRAASSGCRCASSSRR